MAAGPAEGVGGASKVVEEWKARAVTMRAECPDLATREVAAKCGVEFSRLKNFLTREKKKALALERGEEYDSDEDAEEVKKQKKKAVENKPHSAPGPTWFGITVN